MKINIFFKKVAPVLIGLVLVFLLVVFQEYFPKTATITAFLLAIPLLIYAVIKKD